LRCEGSGTAEGKQLIEREFKPFMALMAGFTAGNAPEFKYLELKII